MNPPIVDRDALRRLPVAERLLLVEDLWDSIATDTPAADIPMSPLLMAELERRLVDLKDGRERTMPWAAVRESILRDGLHGS
jgi:putative addiction module component (TIGR02574 family)